MYIGAILGAGFASGEEILQYFVIYEYKGFLGMILASILFIIIGWAVMDIVYKHNIQNYQQFTRFVFGERLGFFIEISSMIFMIMLFGAMLSAGGVMAEEVFKVNSKKAIIFFAVICFITFNFDLKGIIFINQVVSPFLIIGGVALGLYTFFENTIFTVAMGIGKNTHKWILSAVIYVTYNIITAISVLTGLKNIIISKKIAKYGAVLGGFLLGTMGFSIALGIWANYVEVVDLQLPMLGIAAKYGNIIKNLYIILMLLAMYTTAVLNGYEIIEWIKTKYKINKYIIMIVITLGAVLLAQMSFSNIVSNVYPLFAYVGGFEMWVILFTAIFLKSE